MDELAAAAAVVAMVTDANAAEGEGQRAHCGTVGGGDDTEFITVD